jgi:hypothetical protein
VIALATALLLACPDSARAVQGTEMPWVYVVEHLGCERLRLADAIATGHQQLRARARAEAPALLTRIDAAPPAPTPTGYALLPVLNADPAYSTVALTETFYSLAWLSGQSDDERRAAARFVAATASDSAPLEPLIGEYDRLKGRLRWLEESVTYHRYWQQASEDFALWFAGKNQLVRRARTLKAMLAEAVIPPQTAAVRDALAREVAPFTRAPSLAIVTRGDGLRELAVTVVTDITDSVFLQAFTDAVEREWNASAAARAAKLRIVLSVTRLSPSALYPEGPPAPGASIDEAAHLTRFPPGALVLTTGAKSTHAVAARYIQLGTAAIGPRVLAHEFGHLLGFADAYLRGTEGSSAERWGYTIVEWSGLQDDLMGAPASGRVSEAMIAQLLTAYGGV